jgi:hypothetical protein
LGLEFTTTVQVVCPHCEEEFETEADVDKALKFVKPVILIYMDLNIYM